MSTGSIFLTQHRCINYLRNFKGTKYELVLPERGVLSFLGFYTGDECIQFETAEDIIQCCNQKGDYFYELLIIIAIIGILGAIILMRIN